MAIYVSKPEVVLGEYEIPRQDIIDDALRRHPDHKRISVLPRVLGNTPERRVWSQSWETVIGERSYQQRNEMAFADLTDMGTRAARAALETAGVEPGEVTAVVTSHTTGTAMPGLDMYLQHALGLPDTVQRRPITQLGCGGGAHALVMAAWHLAADPDAKVLVCVSESLSSIRHHADDSLGALALNALWGDAGAACVVSGTPLTAGLEIDGQVKRSTWEYVVPNSHDRYRLRMDAAGMHFDSTPQGPQSINDMSPALLKWLSGEADGGRPWGLDSVIAHAGGLRILDDLATNLGVDKSQIGCSYKTLDREGNLGGASVLRALQLTYDTPPADGAEGILVGFAPSFGVSAMKWAWQNGPTG